MDRRLPPSAYSPKPGEKFVPLTAGQRLPEFTLGAILTGIMLGVLFGAANAYLGLKAGLTISTSIPVAVLTVVAFRVLARFGPRRGLLEANMSQTVGSASSSVASGVLFTVPALFMWGQDPAWAQITLLAMAGGLIGVLAMVPLRRFLIVEEHGKLPYPEGMACAEVLVAAEGGGRQARPVFLGIGVGMLFKLMTDGLKVMGGKFSFGVGGKAAVSVSMSPALLGVGYILGPKIASVMAGGGALAALVLIPAIDIWGAEFTEPVYPETVHLIKDMPASDIWNRYIRYIGAGAVAVAGFITLIKSIPTMIECFKIGLAKLKEVGGSSTSDEEADEARRDLDLSLGTVLKLVGVIVLVIAFVPGVLGAIDSVFARILAAVLIAVFAFFFVTVSSRIVGLVGQTSNPTSGMTIATLLGTSAIFWMLGWTDITGKVTALLVGTGVCIAASIAGDASQDLKTGYVLGATPRWQQIGELVGVITSAGVVCLVVIMLDRGTPGGLGGEELPAPQGTLMKLVIDGVLDQNLPWPLIGIGAGIAIIAALCKVPVLAFAVGVYLPLSTMAAVFCGGALRWFLTRNLDEETAEARRERGTLFGSGLVGGAGLMGVGLALWAVANGGQKIQGIDLGLPTWISGWLPLVGIAAILGLMARSARRA